MSLNFAAALDLYEEGDTEGAVALAEEARSNICKMKQEKRERGEYREGDSCVCSDIERCFVLDAVEILERAAPVHDCSTMGEVPWTHQALQAVALKCYAWLGGEELDDMYFVLNNLKNYTPEQRLLLLKAVWKRPMFLKERRFRTMWSQGGKCITGYNLERLDVEILAEDDDTVLILFFEAICGPSPAFVRFLVPALVRSGRKGVACAVLLRLQAVERTIRIKAFLDCDQHYTQEETAAVFEATMAEEHRIRLSCKRKEIVDKLWRQEIPPPPPGSGVEDYWEDYWGWELEEDMGPELQGIFDELAEKRFMVHEDADMTY